MSTKTSGYSSRLFRKLYEDIQTLISKIKHPGGEAPTYTLEGFWAFSYLKGADALQSSYFDCKRDINDKIRKTVNDTTLDSAYGSMGSFFKAAQAGKGIVKILANTFDDPGGAVCTLDAAIGQEHACFISIKFGEEHIGVLDIFFSGHLRKRQSKGILAALSHVFQNTGSDLLRLAVDAFKFREQEKVLEIQAVIGDTFHTYQDSGLTVEEQIDKRIAVAVANIEKLAEVSSLMPLFCVKSDEQEVTSPSLVGVNFPFIHAIIKHELKFCGLTAAKMCYHFKEYDRIFLTDAFCENAFLNFFYYEPLKRLDGGKISTEFSFANEYGPRYQYELEVFFIPDEDNNITDDLATIITADTLDDIRKQINNFVVDYDERPSLTAREKFQDELIFEYLKDKLQQKVIAIQLSRVIDKSLEYCVSCLNRNNVETKGGKVIKNVISNYKVQQELNKESRPSKNFVRINLPKKQVVQVEIVQSAVLLDALKADIAKKPEKYLLIIAPYVQPNDPSRPRKHEVLEDELTFSFVGRNLFQEAYYQSAIASHSHVISGLIKSKDVVRFARKSAISQVFSRNMSHNHGSHVLSRLVHANQIEELRYFHEAIRFEKTLMLS